MYTEAVAMTQQLHVKPVDAKRATFIFRDEL
jgi:hypothetical protein